MTALLQKVSTLNAMVLSAQDVFAMGTMNGKALLDLPVGAIEAGYYADFAGIDLRDLSVQPLGLLQEQLLPNLVYSMQPHAISQVVVGGIEQIKGGRRAGMSEEKIYNCLQSLLEKLHREA